MSSVAQTGTRPPALSALRLARAAAVAEQLAQAGKATYLADLRARMRFRGLSNGQTDKAVDDLADARRVTITTSVYGGLVIRLGGGM